MTETRDAAGETIPGDADSTATRDATGGGRRTGMDRNTATWRSRHCDYLTTADRFVIRELLSLADHATCAIPTRFSPTVPELIEWTALSKATVYRARRHLRAHGWLDWKEARLHSIDLVKPPVQMNLHAQAELEDVKADMRRLLGIDPPMVIDEDQDIGDLPLDVAEDQVAVDVRDEGHDAVDGWDDSPAPPTPMVVSAQPARCARCGSLIQGVTSGTSVICAGCTRRVWT